MGLLLMTPIKSATAAGPPFTPSDLSPFVWFRGDSTTGTGSTFQMTDLSGNGLHASVPSGVTAPTKQTAVINGQDIVRFTEASGSYLAFGSSIIADANTGHDVIMIFKAAATVPSSPGFQVPFTYATHASRSQSFVMANFASYEPLCWGGGDGLGGSIGITGYDYSSAFHYFLGRFNGAGTFVSTANWTEERNSVAQTDTGVGGTVNSSAAQNLIGAYAPPSTPFACDMDVAEIIVCPTMSGTLKTQLASYLNARYGI